MNNSLRKIAVMIGLFLLVVSMFWSQDGFNFDLAGDSGGTSLAIVVGWGMAVSVTVVQFVFSTNYRELNPSLVLFGVIAYVYSIYTNYQGILHFQGESANQFGAAILGFVMDGVPEPLIAWGLRESLSGDWIGNLVRALSSSPQKRSSVYHGQTKNPKKMRMNRHVNDKRYREPIRRPSKKPEMPNWMKELG